MNNMVQLSLINTLEMFNIHSHPRLEIVFFLFENIRRSVSHLICFQYLSFRIVATLLCHIFYNNRYTMEFSLTVLSYKLEVLLLFLFPSEDRIYTDSRRIKPNSRSSLLSEQLNPSKLLHLEDEKSRHRGVKPFGQYELSQTINLLSLA